MKEYYNKTALAIGFRIYLYNMAPRKKEDYRTMQEVSRNKILMAALELFAGKGYAATSTDSIAKKAKVSKGLIYHYFKSKQDILSGIFAYLMEEGNELMNANNQLPPGKVINNLIDYSFDYIVNKAKLNRLLIAIAIQPEVVKGLKEELDKAKEVWMGIMIRMFKELNFQQPEAEAYLLSAMLDGVGLGYLALGEDYPLKKIKRLIEERYGL